MGAVGYQKNIAKKTERLALSILVITILSDKKTHSHTYAFSDHKRTKQNQSLPGAARPLIIRQLDTHSFCVCLLVEIRFGEVYFTFPKDSREKEGDKRKKDRCLTSILRRISLLFVCFCLREETEVEMEMMYYQLAGSSYQDSLKVLEADIQHANSL